MRAAPRLRKRLLGPSPREARIFFTPALVAGVLIVVWVLVAFLAIGESADPGISPAFVAHCFLAGEAGPISVRTAFLVLVIALAVNFSLVLVGWLVEANRDGWDAYLPWRLSAGLWAACVLALVAILGASVLATPGPEPIVRHATGEWRGGEGAKLRHAVSHWVPGAEEAVRDLLTHHDFGSRFEAAATLRALRGRTPDLDRVMKEAVRELRNEVGLGAPDYAVAPSLKRIWTALALLVPDHIDVPSTPGNRVRLAYGEAPPAVGEFLDWWDGQETILFP